MQLRSSFAAPGAALISCCKPYRQKISQYITGRTTTNTGHCAVIQTILIQLVLRIIGTLCVRLKAVVKVTLKLMMMSNNDDDDDGNDDDDDDDDDERHNYVQWSP
jgi:hypothetical protein